MVIFMAGAPIFDIREKTNLEKRVFLGAQI